MQQQLRTKIFVSRHNHLELTSKEVLDFCKKHNVSASLVERKSNKKQEEKNDEKIPIHNQDEASTFPLQETNQKNVAPVQHNVVVHQCLFCRARNTMTIDLTSGSYKCAACDSNGSWYDFKLQVGQRDTATPSKAGSPANNDSNNSTDNPNRAPVAKSSWSITSSSGQYPNTMSHGSSLHPPPDKLLKLTPTPMPSQRLANSYVERLHQPNDNNVLKYLVSIRGLSAETLHKYKVGRATYKFAVKKGQFQDTECVTFPWMLLPSELQVQEEMRGNAAHINVRDDDDYLTSRIKARAIEDKSLQRLDPGGGGWGLFGWHTVPPDATELVLTEGEYDAMAVYQATGRPAVSLPNGCRSLPVQILPLLERFETIYLWMDDDLPGHEGAEKFVKKIGIQRCRIVRPLEKDDDDDDESQPKDANDALLKGVDMEEMIKEASVWKHEYVLRFCDIRDEVLDEIVNPFKTVGAMAPSLPTFSNLIKGFRRGEMTVLTGSTGSGKTTLLSQLSLDFVEQGIPTLWGSFEIQNVRLMRKLMQQFVKGPLGNPNDTDFLERLEAVADQFEELPLYFLKFHGGSDVDDVLNAMDFAVYVHDVEHIILDNLQFMISRAAQSSRYGKFDAQDSAVARFRQFATDKNIHVTLVVHPRKEDENTKLSLASVFGSAKATQEADSVLILQKDGQRKYIDVQKNRFDGTLGKCPLHFDPNSGRYNEAAAYGGGGFEDDDEDDDDEEEDYDDPWEERPPARM